MSDKIEIDKLCSPCKIKYRFTGILRSCTKCGTRIITQKKKIIITERTDGINIKCSKCNKWKSPDYYHKNAKPGRMCKLCYKAFKKEYYQRPEVKQKEYIYLMKRYFKNKFNITLDEYKKILIEQNGVCAICFNPEYSVHGRSQKPVNLAVDHCHKTGKVRGLLCRSCNQVLGHFKDDVMRFKSAITYLNRVL